MDWFKKRKAPEVKISGNRFVIERDPDDCNVIDVTPERTDLPMLRTLETIERPAPRVVGTIPQHSWGC
ncbi:MAG TPA: hypothetical protein VE422_30865 [Terriglobia bacterium]|nr:hypothetical protein [Terriglobia bacterium]